MTIVKGTKRVQMNYYAVKCFISLIYPMSHSGPSSLLLEIVIQLELLQLELLTLVVVVGAIGAPSHEHVGRQKQ